MPSSKRADSKAAVKGSGGRPTGRGGRSTIGASRARPANGLVSPSPRAAAAPLPEVDFRLIADSLPQPSSPAGKDIDAAAGVITADLCQLTGNQPAAVCALFPAGSTGG